MSVRILTNSAFSPLCLTVNRSYQEGHHEPSSLQLHLGWSHRIWCTSCSRIPCQRQGKIANTSKPCRFSKYAGTSPVIRFPVWELDLGAGPRHRKGHHAGSPSWHRGCWRNSCSNGWSRLRHPWLFVGAGFVEGTMLCAADVQWLEYYMFREHWRKLRTNWWMLTRVEGCAYAVSSTFLISSHMFFAVKSPELEDPIVKKGQSVTRTSSVSWDAIANVTGGCPSAVLHLCHLKFTVTLQSLSFEVLHNELFNIPVMEKNPMHTITLSVQEQRV
jgi:hypothetical protein